MISTENPIQNYFSRWSVAWNEFWFRPNSSTTLAVMRILVGVLVFYTHLVWTFELTTFLGADGMLPSEYRSMLFDSSLGWSHLDWFSSGSALMGVHIVGLIVIALFTVGFATRWTSIATVILVISYANRGTGGLFGLDQINAFLCLYLAIGNCGAVLSIDAWLSKKRNAKGQGSGLSTRNRIATRLIQVHMCIVYLFAAIGKLQGDSWFTGEAIWAAFASYEYQTFDMTWLANHMSIVAILTLGALAWELCYAALIWPRLTRPIILLIAIPVHLGIGICMGMMEFGLIMLVGNLAFVDPCWLNRCLNRWLPGKPTS